MPRKRLTEQNVLSLTASGKVTACRWWDIGTDAVRGLHVLVQKQSGTRTYIVAYRFPGSPKDRYMKLGRVGEVTLEEVRTKALAVRRAAAKGDDPKTADPLTSDTFKSCVEKWIEQEQLGRKECVSAAPTRKYILTSCQRWHDRPIATLRYAEIEDLLCSVRRKSPYSSLRLHSHLATLFRWATRTKRIPVNPMTDMPKPWMGAKRRVRDWFDRDADDVLRKVWQAADELGGDQAKFVKLIILTGKRRTAVETMRWDHIDADWYWRPTCGNKVKRAHAIPLPRLAQRILSPRAGKGLVLHGIKPDKLLIELRRMTGVPDLIFHGFRHVVQTKLAQLKIPPHIRDQLMDHAPARGTGAAYDHHLYVEEQRDALERWADYVEALMQPSNTVRVLR